jgi:hypothetical protein
MPHKNKRGKTHPNTEGHTKEGFKRKKKKDSPKAPGI